MRIFGRNKRRSELPGQSFFEAALWQAYRRLSVGDYEGLWRACLCGGSIGAKLVVTQDPKLAFYWGRGNQIKAARLIEVWTSTVLVTMFQNEADQHAVCQGAASGLANVVFDSDEQIGYQELWSYMRQAEADNDTGQKGGIPSYAYTLLYLRCLRALGKDTRFSEIPVPIESISGLLHSGLLDSEDNPNIITITNLMTAHRLSCESAVDFHQSCLRKAR